VAGIEVLRVFFKRCGVIFAGSGAPGTPLGPSNSRAMSSDFPASTPLIAGSLVMIDTSVVAQDLLQLRYSDGRVPLVVGWKVGDQAKSLCRPSNRVSSDSTPPAEAPMPTMGNDF
jgi:hypothetical protein